MKKYYLPMSVSLVVSFLFVFVYAYGASTISTNISTGGTLTVSGNSSLGTITSGTWNGTAIGDAYLTKTGDWTGTFDGYNGPAIAMGTTSVASITTLANLVTVGTIGTGLWQGTVIDNTYLDADLLTWTSASTTYMGIATTSVASITTLANLVTTGTITSGIWSAGALTSSGALTVNGTGDSYIAGNVGVGTSTPATELSVLGTATTTLYLHSSSATAGGCLQLEGPDGSIFNIIATSTGPAMILSGACK